MRIENQAAQALNLLSKASGESIKAGDVIQGKVLSLENSTLVLELPGGTTFSARVPEGFVAAPGTLLSLEIAKGPGQQLSAHIMNPEVLTESRLTMEGAGLMLFAEGQLAKLGGERLEGLLSDVMSFVQEKNAPGLEKAAFLMTNGMENQKDMQALLDKLIEGEFKINEKLTGLRQSLEGGLALKENSGAKALVMKALLLNEGGGKLLNVLAEEAPALLKALQQSQGQSPSQSQSLVQGDAGVREKLTQGLEKLLTSLMEKAPEGEKAAAALGTAARENGAPVLKESVAALLREAGLNETLLPKQGSTLEAKLSQIIQKTQENLRQIPDSDEKTVSEVLKRTFEKVFTKIEDGKAEALDFKESTRELKELLQLSQKALTMMDSQTREGALPIVRDLEAANRFFNQTSNYNLFMQVPLTVNGRETAGELYIMKRKGKRKEINPQNFTLFLALDTKNLGHVETFLNASNKFVTVSIRVGNEALVKLVKASYNLLYEGLKSKGYKLAELKCRLLSDEGVNLLNAEGETETELGLNRKVDLRI